MTLEDYIQHYFKFVTTRLLAVSDVEKARRIAEHMVQVQKDLISAMWLGRDGSQAGVVEGASDR